MKDDNSVYFNRDTNSFVGLDLAFLKQLQDTYKGLDVSVELNRMVLWLQTPKGKRRKGNVYFIIKWLNNARPLQVPETAQIIDREPLLAQFFDTYLEGLWKNREHILKMNTFMR